MVGVDRCRVDARGVGEPGDEITGEGPFGARFGHGDDCQCLALRIEVVGQQLGSGHRHRRALIDVQVIRGQHRRLRTRHPRIDPHRQPPGGGEAVVVAQCVGDGFDAGEPGVGRVAKEAAEVDHGAVRRGSDLDDAERVAVGIEVVAEHERLDLRAGIRPRRIITSHGRRGRGRGRDGWERHGDDRRDSNQCEHRHHPDPHWFVGSTTPRSACERAPTNPPVP